MSIGVGIIGGGIFAREEHLPAVEASKHLTLKAIYSRSLKSAQTLSTNTADVTLYSDDSGPGKSYADLLSRSDVHAVIVALPIPIQPEFIKKALTASKHVLSEKPIAGTLSDAKALIDWYHENIDVKRVSWGVAENFRYLKSFDYAADQVPKMGRVLGFRVRMQTLVTGGKYYETEWRKVPSYQGGFLLDGGVHFTAGLRLLLGKANPLAEVSAQTAQLQEHLTPLDTIDAALITKQGATGTVSISFGTTFKGSEWSVACDKGVVSVSGSTVKVGDEEQTVNDERSGVPPEIRMWGEALSQGTVNQRQSTEEALGDLELIEAMLRSGEEGGTKVVLKYQEL